MKSAHKVPRAALVVSLVAFLSTTLLATAGCWFTPGKERFAQKCREVRGKGNKRWKVCR